MKRMTGFYLIIGLLLLVSCQTSNNNKISLGSYDSRNAFLQYLSQFPNEEIMYLNKNELGNDNTFYIQSLIDSEAKVIVFTADSTPWQTGPLFISRDNLTIIFEPGARLEAKEGLFTGNGECLLTIRNATNISLKGFGGIEGFYMRKKDYQKAPYEKGEWRHCLSLISTKDFRINGLTLAESGGDGIYIGQAKKDGIRTYCLNTTIENCMILNNHRQGISVISAENLLIENTICWGTSGTLPKAGIDFEPNRPVERFINCRVVNCRFERNSGPGIHIYLRKLNESSIPVDITLEENYCRNNLLGIGINLSQLQNHPRGRVILKNNDFGISLFNKIPRNRSITVIEEQN